MDEGQSDRTGKIIFWITVAFCTWITWYITAPVGEHPVAGKKEEVKAEKAE